MQDEERTGQLSTESSVPSWAVKGQGSTVEEAWKGTARPGVQDTETHHTACC